MFLITKIKDHTIRDETFKKKKIFKQSFEKKSPERRLFRCLLSIKEKMASEVE